MVAGIQAARWLLTGMLGLLLMQPAVSLAYDQARWEELTKKEADTLRQIKMRPLPVPAKGKVTQNIACYFDETYHYTVYVPKNYDPKKAWPVVFFNAPTGNAGLFCQMYQPYADQLGWILVGATESKNGPLTEPIENNICMIKDVLQRFHVHKEMSIAAGFSGGARLAGMLAFADQDYPWMMGAIQMGAAKGPLPPVAGKQIYLIVGTLDPNYPEVKAWDKACRVAGCKVEKFEWLAPHTYPSGTAFYQALKWQTDNFLLHSTDTSEDTQQRRQDYVLDLIDQAHKGDSGNKVVDIYLRYRIAYEAGSTIPCGLKVSKQAQTLERRMSVLARYPDVKKEVECYIELKALIERVEREAAVKALVAAETAEAPPEPEPAPAAEPEAELDPEALAAKRAAEREKLLAQAEAEAQKAAEEEAARAVAEATLMSKDGETKPAETEQLPPPPPPATDDDEMIPEDDDLLPAELERRKAEAKKIEAEAAARAAKQAEEARQAAIPPWDTARAIAKKYPKTPSALRAELLAKEWQLKANPPKPVQVAGAPKAVYGLPLPPAEDLPTPGHLQPTLPPPSPPPQP